MEVLVDIKTKIDLYTKMYEAEAKKFQETQKQLEEIKSNLIRIEGAIYALREFLPKEGQTDETINKTIDDSGQS